MENAKTNDQRFAHDSLEDDYEDKKPVFKYGNLIFKPTLI